MAIPVHLATSFFLDESLVAIVDVADIITELDVELKTTNSPAWTEPSADRFKSPVDSDGRFMEVLFVRDSAVLLSVENFDQNAVSLRDGSFEIAVTDSIRILSGQFHLYIVALTGAAAVQEGAYSIMCDFSPSLQTISAIFVAGATQRNSAGVISADDEATETTMIESGTPTNRVRGMNLAPADHSGSGELIYADGSSFFIDCLIMQNPSGTLQFGGRFYQCFIVPDGFAVGTRISIPIDDGTLGEFDVTYEDAIGNIRLAIRSNS